MFVSDSKSPSSENGLVLLDGLYRDRQISFDLYCQHCLNSTELYSMHEHHQARDMTFQVRMGYQHKIANVCKYGPNKGMIKFRVIKETSTLDRLPNICICISL